MELITEFLACLFIDGFYYLLGLTGIWLKNGGKKSFEQIRQETEDLPGIGKSFLGEVFVGLLVFLLIGLLITVIYSIF